jgi:hypothetical protein
MKAQFPPEKYNLIIRREKLSPVVKIKEEKTGS